MSNPKEVLITLTASYDGFSFEVATNASVDQIPAMVKRLRAIGCMPLQPPAARQSEGNGTSEHSAPVRAARRNSC